MPVLAANVVATSQPLAAQAGLAALAAGGNAVDAALAAAITLTVVEPTNNGLGSDAFAIVWDPQSRRVLGLNASGRSPSRWTESRFDGARRVPGLGWDSVTVPGAVSAWVELSGRFGRLPFEDLFKAAIAYADGGFLISPVVARQWDLVSSVFGGFGEFARVFLPGGRAPRSGEMFRLPDLARSLDSVATSKGESFYRGELATAVAVASRAGGGVLDEHDLAAHRADWVEPIAIDFEAVRVHEIPPNGQGIAAQMALGMLAHTRVLEFAPDSAASLHFQIEAMKLAFADVYRAVADPSSMRVGVDALLDPDYLACRAGDIDAERASDFEAGRPIAGDTVYLCAADAAGMMVSYIQSNYFSFGSGIVVPGTGISLQNRGSGFCLEHGHPNCVGPSKRPFHTIIPGFVTRGAGASPKSDTRAAAVGGPAAVAQEPVTAFGLMGGPMQPQGHLQLMLRIFGHGQNPQAAADAPRWQIAEGRTVLVEEEVAESVRAGLVARGHDVSVAPALMFGGAQVIHKIQGGYLAASESRKDGHAVGF
ncbi:MAG: gamma-glutamyltransferase family protein [Deltaproteobacteria bacterium]|nr:gamma-glutamyltransferase family protein [Deltaproteobacteria bacterium]